MSTLKVYKASAGSGKTYRLALEYIKLLIARPDAYRHILAVTFTNKAAGEMKERILHDLSILADPKLAREHPDSLLRVLVEELHMGGREDKVPANAAQALHLLLHDYSHFQIETIDSFFQRILRNLTRELGIGSSLNIDLDSDTVVEKAVDRLIDQAAQDPQTLDWINSCLQDRMNEGKSVNIQKELKSFGKTIYREIFQQHRQQLTAVLEDKKYLGKFQGKMIQMQRQIEQRLKAYAEQFFRIIKDHSLGEDRFPYYKSGGLPAYFHSLEQGDFLKEMGKRLIEAYNDVENCWKSTEKDAGFRQIVAEEIYPLLTACIEYHQKAVRTLQSTIICTKHLYEIGLLNSISQTAKAINREENSFLLSDTASLLDEMVGDSDASFVFEKIGAPLKHIMIDEFQDTSHLQWGIFKHLLKECLSTGGQDSLVVGDVKQSIYRFRNGDWSILNNIETALPSSYSTEFFPMEDNWRSRRNIVEFNNGLFEQANKILSTSFAAVLNRQLIEQMNKAYQDTGQHCRKTDNEGFVSIRLFNKDTYDTAMTEALLETLNRLQHPQDPQPMVRDICILTRKTKEIRSLAATLNAHGFKVISDEAFVLGSSSLLNCLVAAMKLVLHPNDGISQTDILTYRPKQYRTLTDALPELAQLPLTEMVYAIHRILALDSADEDYDFRDESDFLFSFMDFLNDYLSRGKGHLADFLQYWEDKLQSSFLPSRRQPEGIRIMTIHKAKGLDAHTVIVPYCNWELIEGSTAFKTNQIWCAPQEPPYNEMPLLPVDFQKNMKDSIFEDDYRLECQQQLMDNLNLLYVAFTRPKYNLIVYAPKTDNKEVKTVADLLQRCLSFQQEEYRLGQEPMAEESDTKGAAENGREVVFVNRENPARFRQSNRSMDFIRDEETQGDGSYIERGKLLHHLFELIRHQEDIEKAVQTLVNEALLSASDKDKYLAFAREALAQEQVQDWYSGSYELYTECSILFKDEEGRLQERRPDRVVMKQGKVTVIDFKFGQQKPAHLKQVREYVTLLQRMGFAQVEGYLWYVEQKQTIAC